jgi:hypothetical protein
MGICASSKRVEQEEEDSDENVVYVVMDGQGGGGGGGWGGDGRGAAWERTVAASLFSQKGKKGPNQDAVILCQVRAPPVSLSSAMPRLLRLALFVPAAVLPHGWCYLLVLTLFQFRMIHFELSLHQIISDHYFRSKKKMVFCRFFCGLLYFLRFTHYLCE